MASDDFPDDDRPDLDRWLQEATAEGPGPCPDENALSALAEGRAEEGERDALLSHLVACGDCREIARLLAAAGSPAAAAPRPGFRFRRPAAVAAAAVVLVAVGVWLLLARREQGGVSTASALETAAARLAREHPAEFGDFRPVGIEELRSRGDALRGSDLGASPSGKTLDARPTFRWSAAPGAMVYEVSLLGPEGVRWRRKTSDAELVWPEDVAPLEPGERAVWTLVADDPQSTRVERAVALVTDPEAKRWSAAQAVAASVKTPLRSLLLAQAALRLGLNDEAATFAKAFLAAVPGDDLGTATLAAARAGSPSR